MGRPRKNTTGGGDATAVTNGSLDSPMAASTAIVTSGSLRRSGRLKTKNLLMIDQGKGKSQKLKEIMPSPEPNKEILSNQEPNKEILSDPELNSEISPNLNNGSFSNPVSNNGGFSNPVSNNGGFSNPVPNNESLSNPVANNGRTVEETDKAPNEQENQTEMLLAARIESKIDFLVESVKEFKHVGVKRASPDETTPAQELTYKSMYFESQRKIQELEEEIRELSKENEVSQAKVEMLQQINVSLQNLNNISLVSNFGKATEAIVSLAAQGKLNVAAEEATAPAPAQAQIAAAEAFPPARRSTKRAR